MSAPRWITKFEIKPGSWVYVPSAESEIEGRQITEIIRKRWTPPSHFYHLNAGGHVKALQAHLKNRAFACIDIKDFFGSIGRSRITRALTGKVSYEQARSMAKRSTVPVENKPHSHALPFGFTQSPILASICLENSALGKTLRQITNSRVIEATVYMDDIVLSSDDPVLLEKSFDDVIAATKRSSFLVNEKKTQPPSPIITTFNIELSRDCMKITEKRLAELIANYWSSTNNFQKDGILNYIVSVNPLQASCFLGEKDHNIGSLPPVTDWSLIRLA